MTVTKSPSRNVNPRVRINTVMTVTVSSAMMPNTPEAAFAVSRTMSNQPVNHAGNIREGTCDDHAKKKHHHHHHSRNRDENEHQLHHQHTKHHHRKRAKHHRLTQSARELEDKDIGGLNRHEISKKPKDELQTSRVVRSAAATDAGTNGETHPGKDDERKERRYNSLLTTEKLQNDHTNEVESLDGPHSLVSSSSPARSAEETKPSARRPMPPERRACPGAEAVSGIDGTVNGTVVWGEDDADAAHGGVEERRSDEPPAAEQLITATLVEDEPPKQSGPIVTATRLRCPVLYNRRVQVALAIIVLAAIGLTAWGLTRSGTSPLPTAAPTLPVPSVEPSSAPSMTPGTLVSGRFCSQDPFNSYGGDFCPIELPCRPCPSPNERLSVCFGEGSESVLQVYCRSALNTTSRPCGKNFPQCPLVDYCIPCKTYAPLNTLEEHACVPGDTPVVARLITLGGRRSLPATVESTGYAICEYINGDTSISLPPAVMPVAGPTILPPGPTFPPVPATVLPSSVAPAVSEPSVAPTSSPHSAVDCIIAMNIADVDPEDNFLNQREYVIFVNELSDGSFDGLGFASLDVAIRMNFFQLAGDNGQIDITGSKPTDDQTDEQIANLSNTCVSTIDILRGLRQPDSSAPATNAPAVMPTPLPATASPFAPPAPGPPTPSELVDFLSSVSPDGGTALRTPGTAQNRAFQDLLIDPLLSDYPDDVLVERYALITFYYSTRGSDWVSSEGWLASGDFCDWEFVECGSGELSSVASIDAQNSRISGPLPPEMGLLTALVFLGLYKNQVSDEIPSELGLLANLVNLDLDSNALDGTIPVELSEMVNTEYFYLNNNELIGTIPRELGSLMKLQSLILSGNELTGSVPEEICGIASLRVLIVDVAVDCSTCPDFVETCHPAVVGE